MDKIWNEGIYTVDQIPQSVECLIMPKKGIQTWRPLHYHDYMELLYVLDGAYELKVGSQLHRLDKNDLYVILPGEPHCTRRLGENQTLLCIKFLPQILFSSKVDDAMPEHLIRLVLDRYSHPRKISAELLNNTVIPQTLTEIIAEFQTRCLGSELAIRANLSRVLLWLVRYWHKAAGEPLLSFPGSYAMAIMAQAREYVQENYPNASLEVAARLCGLSYSYFSHLFNTCMKQSFSDYVNHVRLAQAQKLLIGTDLSITQIAIDVGFSSTSYFAYMFRIHNGISPRTFRNNARFCKQ